MVFSGTIGTLHYETSNTALLQIAFHRKLKAQTQEMIYELSKEAVLIWVYIIIQNYRNSVPVCNE